MAMTADYHHAAEAGPIDRFAAQDLKSRPYISRGGWAAVDQGIAGTAISSSRALTAFSFDTLGRTRTNVPATDLIANSTRLGRRRSSRPESNPLSTTSGLRAACLSRSAPAGLRTSPPHFALDALVEHSTQIPLGTSSILLYLAVTIGVQREVERLSSPQLEGFAQRR